VKAFVKLDLRGPGAADKPPDGRNTPVPIGKRVDHYLTIERIVFELPGAGLSSDCGRDANARSPGQIIYWALRSVPFKVRIAAQPGRPATGGEGAR
jgi:hypothetical protein